MNPIIIEKVNTWLQSDIVNEDDKNEIQHLLETNPKEIEEAFYCNLEFGTGGLRGIMGLGINRMNKYTVGIATQGLANYLIKVYREKEISAVIGRDSRINSEYFSDIVASVLTANNIHVYVFEDICPTPELSFAVRQLQCQAGIMITASHNPKEYNGYKVYWEDGGQLVPPHDLNVINEVQLIKNIEEVKFRGNNSLKKILGKEMDEKYITKLLTIRLQPEIIKQYNDLKIVYTPLHGTGYKIVPEALKRFGFNNIIETYPQNIPDGNFPTVSSPNPEEKEGLKMAIQKATETEADILMATDPDADRIGVGVRNENGEYELLNGNQTGALITYYLLETMFNKQMLNENQMIVKTIVTTDLLNEIAGKYNIKCFDVLTGFKYIAEIIKQYEGKLQFICGGEESYGFLAGDFIRDKDAVMTACLVAEVAAWAKSQNKTLLNILIDIAFEFGLYKEGLVSITKKGISGMHEISDMMESFRNNVPKYLDGKRVASIFDYQKSNKTDLLTFTTSKIDLPTSNVIQYVIEDGSKITMRPSGTEPKIKFYFSVKTKLTDESQYKEKLKELENYILRLTLELGLK